MGDWRQDTEVYPGPREEPTWEGFYDFLVAIQSARGAISTLQNVTEKIGKFLYGYGGWFTFSPQLDDEETEYYFVLYDEYVEACKETIDIFRRYFTKRRDPNPFSPSRFAKLGRYHQKSYSCPMTQTVRSKSSSKGSAHVRR